MNRSVSAVRSRMAEEPDVGFPSRAERKAIEKAKILQRENRRDVFKLVRRNRRFCRRASWIKKHYMSGFSLLLAVGRSAPEESRGRADRGGGRGSTAAPGHGGGAAPEAGPQKCGEEEAGGGEATNPGWFHLLSLNLMAVGVLNGYSCFLGMSLFQMIRINQAVFFSSNSPCSCLMMLMS